MYDKKRALAALAAVGAALLILAAPANAGVLVKAAKDCSADGPSRQVFKPWLDVAQLHARPRRRRGVGDGLEARAGAKVVAGNEPWKVGGAGHQKSLQLPRWISATTDVMCVGVEHPTLRFFAKRSGGTLLSTLLVEVEFEGLGGLLKRLPVGVVLNGGQWQPTLPSLGAREPAAAAPGAAHAGPLPVHAARWRSLADRRRVRRSVEGRWR